jgi:uncharacterized iron-regulated membrane protein
VFLDQYSGKVRPPLPPSISVGDRFLECLAPLRAGSFGGSPIKVIWLVLGLAPSLLFVTGFIMWWRGVVQPGYAQSTASSARVSVR